MLTNKPPADFEIKQKATKKDRKLFTRIFFGEWFFFSRVDVSNITFAFCNNILCTRFFIRRKSEISILCNRCKTSAPCNCSTSSNSPRSERQNGLSKNCNNFSINSDHWYIRCDRHKYSHSEIVENDKILIWICFLRTSCLSILNKAHHDDDVDDGVYCDIDFQGKKDEISLFRALFSHQCACCCLCIRKKPNLICLNMCRSVTKLIVDEWMKKKKIHIKPSTHQNITNSVQLTSFALIFSAFVECACARFACMCVTLVIRKW